MILISFAIQNTNFANEIVSLYLVSIWIWPWLLHVRFLPQPRTFAKKDSVTLGQDSWCSNFIWTTCSVAVATDLTITSGLSSLAVQAFTRSRPLESKRRPFILNSFHYAPFSFPLFLRKDTLQLARQERDGKRSQIRHRIHLPGAIEHFESHHLFHFRRFFNFLIDELLQNNTKRGFHWKERVVNGAKYPTFSCRSTPLASRIPILGYD